MATGKFKSLMQLTSYFSWTALTRLETLLMSLLPALPAHPASLVEMEEVYRILIQTVVGMGMWFRSLSVGHIKVEMPLTSLLRVWSTE